VGKVRVSAYPLIDVDEAALLVLEHTPVLGTERVQLADAIGRVLAEDLVASGPLPAFPSSAVDGYAVRAADAGKALRVLGESSAGRPFDGTVTAGTAARILTGGVVPDGADCVVMVEHVRVSGEEVTVPPSLGRWRAHDAETLTTLHWVAAEALARFGYAAECEPE